MLIYVTYEIKRCCCWTWSTAAPSVLSVRGNNWPFVPNYL